MRDDEAPISHLEQMVFEEQNPEATFQHGIKKAAAASGIQGSSPATLQQQHAIQPSTDDNARQMWPLYPVCQLLGWVVSCLFERVVIFVFRKN